MSDTVSVEVPKLGTFSEWEQKPNTMSRLELAYIRNVRTSALSRGEKGFFGQSVLTNWRGAGSSEGYVST
jgi:hypothetical protein